MKIKELLYISGVIGVIYLLFHLAGIGCPIKWLTGVSCAGCGMTRAWIRLLHFDVEGAFYYHPLFWVPCLVVALFFIKSKLSKRIYNVIILTVVFSFVIIYFARMICGDGMIVVFDPKSGIIYELFSKIL